ncbi:MAG: T9SS type A sorting domain-containing protein, partial [Prevotellaceae bacterium]|nr:T9SS type A sorting domain-containing protein [Prevotellaceae bacterium]
LTFKYRDRNPDEELLLFDTKTRDLVNISADSSVYHFHASATDNGAKRFQILTRKAEIDSEDKEVRVLRINGNTFIDSRSKSTAEITLFDLSGRQLQQTLRLAPGEIKALPSLPGGVYVVEIAVEGKRYLEKVIAP